MTLRVAPGPDSEGAGDAGLGNDKGCASWTAACSRIPDRPIEVAGNSFSRLEVMALCEMSGRALIGILRLDDYEIIYPFSPKTVGEDVVSWSCWALYVHPAMEIRSVDAQR